MSQKRQQLIDNRQDLKEYYTNEISVYEDEAKVLEEKERELIRMLEKTQEKEVQAYD